MSDIRLESLPFELDGKTYQLRSNMNVLAEVQEAFDGDFNEVLNEEHSLRSVLYFLAAMLNEYAEEMGWAERYTAKGLGRTLQRHQVPAAEIMGLVIHSVIPPKALEESAEAPGN